MGAAAGTRGGGGVGVGDWVGHPQSVGDRSPRCLGKLQLFQPSFEICPFETELSMDIAAALKVCLVAWSGLTAPALPVPLPPPGPAVPHTLYCPSSLPPTTLLWRLPLQRGNREWFDKLLNSQSPREQV